MNDEQRKAMFAKQGSKGHGISSGIRAKDNKIEIRTKNGGSGNRLGKGAEVILKKPFGLDQIPVGAKGEVRNNDFGRNSPTVKFKGYDGLWNVSPDNLEVIKSSNKFDPVRYDKFRVYGKKDELKKELLKENWKFSDGGGDWVGGYEYLDDGYGRSFHLPYSVHLKDNEVEVHVKKTDLPHLWQWQFDDIRQGIVDTVKSALGMSDY